MLPWPASACHSWCMSPKYTGIAGGWVARPLRCFLGGSRGWHRASRAHGPTHPERVPRPSLQPAVMEPAKLCTAPSAAALTTAHCKRNSQANTPIDFLSRSPSMDLQTNGVFFRQVANRQLSWP